MIQRLTLPSFDTLRSTADKIADLDLLLPQVPVPPLEHFVRKGEYDHPGHFLYGPRFPIKSGQYLALYWLRVQANSAVPRLVFDAVLWNCDTATPLASHVTAVKQGTARTLVFPLRFAAADTEQVELRAWADANSGAIRVLGVQVHRIRDTSHQGCTRSKSLKPSWRQPRVEAIGIHRPDRFELWLALPPIKMANAFLQMRAAGGTAYRIEIVDPSTMAQFLLADGRFLLALTFRAQDIPELVGNFDATLAVAGRTFDIGEIELFDCRRGSSIGPARNTIQIRRNLIAIEEPTGHAIELLVGKEHGRERPADVSTTILRLWRDFPLAAVPLDYATISGRFIWDTSGLRLRDGIIRWPSGGFPAIALSCGPSGGSCIVRHKHREIPLDLSAARPGFCLVFPTLPRPVVQLASDSSTLEAIEIGIPAMFRRIREYALDETCQTARNWDPGSASKGDPL